MTLEALLRQVRACTVCVSHLPFAPKPILRAHAEARLLIIGQAPGMRVQDTGIPWNDPSGDRLRQWLGVTPTQFYHEKAIAIIPMGFCYPGKGAAGDLPPRPECAPLWHDKLLAKLPNLKLTLLIGQYAQAHYLGNRRKKTLTDTIKAWEEYLPDGFLPLVHPSPRNQIWLKKNSWFEKDMVPELKKRVKKILG